VVELVGDVPAERPKLAPLLDGRVEEEEADDHLLEHVGLDALAEVGLVDRLQRARDVGAQPLGRLLRHLDRILEDGLREASRRRRREPEPKLGVRAVDGDLLAHLLEHGHPRLGEVAVL
jgi:hypothetical protein